jgi:hypothetical protein
MYKYNTTYQSISFQGQQALGVLSLDLDMHALSQVLHIIRKSGRRFGIFQIISYTATTILYLFYTSILYT